jgi:hypothetical protein
MNNFFTGFCIMVSLLGMVYIVSRIQMKAYLHEMEKFLNSKLDSINKTQKENEK